MRDHVGESIVEERKIMSFQVSVPQSKVSPNLYNCFVDVCDTQTLLAKKCITCRMGALAGGEMSDSAEEINSVPEPPSEL